MLYRKPLLSSRYNADRVNCEICLSVINLEQNHIFFMICFNHVGLMPFFNHNGQCIHNLVSLNRRI